ncbi:hypothetical protein NQD34_013186 [Periophthalmus magnuspinnatus]|nr:hypothetical protein NQD34_013186 [Periophthalmus magnuspinnatus]
MTSTPLKHAALIRTPDGPEQPDTSLGTPAELRERIRALLMSILQTPTPLKALPPEQECEETSAQREQSNSQQSTGSCSEVLGLSLLGSKQLQLDAGSGPCSVPVSSGSSRSHRMSPGSEDLGCFPLEGGQEVWWCQPPVGYQHSPECPTFKLSPFRLSGELQVVMFGKTDDQVSVTDQARFYIKT